MSALHGQTALSLGKRRKSHTYSRKTISASVAKLMTDGILVQFVRYMQAKILVNSLIFYQRQLQTSVKQVSREYTIYLNQSCQ